MRRSIPIVVAAISLLVQASAFACPFCKDSVPNSDAQMAGGVPSGFNNTIYMMLLGLFAVIGMVAVTLVKGARSSAGQVPRAGRGFPLE